MTFENPAGDMLSACLGGNLKRVKELLDWGVDPRSLVDNRTLIQHAAGAGFHMIVKTLMQAGALGDREALLLAIRSGNRHSVTYIADAMHFQGDDPFAFAWAPTFGSEGFASTLTPEVARWLVANGLDVNETDNMGQTLIDIARSHASEEVIAALLSRSYLRSC